MPPGETSVPGGPPANQILSTLAVGVTVVAGLYLGREILVPLALAVLLSFALAPLVMLLRRWRLGRAPSVVVAVTLTVLLFSVTGMVIGGQIGSLAENLPQYRSTIIAKVRSLSGLAASQSLVGKASAILQDLNQEIASPERGDAVPAQPAGRTQGRPERKANPDPMPLPVEVRAPDPAPLQLIRRIVTPLLGPLFTTGLVIVFLTFFLLQREDLRDRFIRLTGCHDLQRTTIALDEAARRLSRYLLFQTAINTGFGLLIGCGLALIGVPNPVLWGVLAGLLRFVPYVGPFIAAGMPIAMAVAVDPGWSMALWTLALFVVVEPIIGQFVEPFLYGRSTGLSAVAIVVAAAFWTWLWGPVGLLLSTPLTLCLVVLGRHVERLAFLDVILSDRPALGRDQNFYQRMLANDPDEAALQAEEYLRTGSLEEYYDEIVVPALRLAQQDADRGTLRLDQQMKVKNAIDGLIDDLEQHALPGDASGRPPGHIVLCIAGRSLLDQAAASLLAHLLRQQGNATIVLPPNAYSSVRAEADPPAEIACLCYLDAAAAANARFLIRRVKRRAPAAETLICILAEEGATRPASEVDGAVTDLAAAVDRIRREPVTPRLDAPGRPLAV